MFLARRLEANRDLTAEDYVLVTVDAHDANGEKLLVKVRGEVGSVPWLAICDSTGKALATSEASGINVGCAANAAGARHFDAMFGKTARRLTDAELQMLMGNLY
jgi:hypothetical protein